MSQPASQRASEPAQPASQPCPAVIGLPLGCSADGRWLATHGASRWLRAPPHSQSIQQLPRGLALSRQPVAQAIHAVDQILDLLHGWRALQPLCPQPGDDRHGSPPLSCGQHERRQAETPQARPWPWLTIPGRHPWSATLGQWISIEATCPRHHGRPDVVEVGWIGDVVLGFLTQGGDIPRWVLRSCGPARTHPARCGGAHPATPHVIGMNGGPA